MLHHKEKIKIYVERKKQNWHLSQATIICIGNLKIQIIKLVKEVSKITDYKFNAHKLVAFLYTNN